VFRADTYSSRGLNWDDSGELVTLIESLDEWLSRRGFMPEDWERPGLQSAFVNDTEGERYEVTELTVEGGTVYVEINACG
jgi:hypothetical protein